MTKKTKDNHKENFDDFSDIRQELRKKGFNARFWAKQTGFKYCTVNFALAGFPRTELAATIRREPRAYTDSNEKRIRETVERMFAK